jgi:hypothetical protein
VISRLAAFLSGVIRHLRLTHEPSTGTWRSQIWDSPRQFVADLSNRSATFSLFLTLTVPRVGDAGGLLPSVMHDAASVKVLGHGKWIQLEESRCGVRDQGQRC